MQQLFKIWLLCVFIASCSNGIKADQPKTPAFAFKETTLTLTDSLGSVTLAIPARYDTAFSWVHYSDCGRPCNYQKYRFQPKALPVSKESGWYWTGEPTDSIDRFTIEHRQWIDTADKANGNLMLKAGLHIAKELALVTAMDDSVTLILTLDTVQRINGRDFAIAAYEGHNASSGKYSRMLVGLTPLKGDFLRFVFRLLTRNNDSTTANFISESRELLNQVRITNGL